MATAARAPASGCSAFNCCRATPANTVKITTPITERPRLPAISAAKLVGTSESSRAGRVWALSMVLMLCCSAAVSLPWLSNPSAVRPLRWVTVIPTTPAIITSVSMEPISTALILPRDWACSSLLMAERMEVNTNGIITTLSRLT